MLVHESCSTCTCVIPSIMARSYLCTIIYSHAYAWGYHVYMLQRRVRIFADKRVCGRTRVITRYRGCSAEIERSRDCTNMLDRWLLIGIGPFMIRNIYTFDISLIHLIIYHDRTIIKGVNFNTFFFKRSIFLSKHSIIVLVPLLFEYLLIIIFQTIQFELLL